MMWSRRTEYPQRFVWLTLTLCVCFSGCRPPAAGSATPPKPPEVLVSLPVEETVTEFEEVTGRTWATDTIEVRSRVSGYLDKVYFKDGAEIKRGDPLFEIDRRPYQAELDKANAELDKATSGVKSAEAHRERLVRQEARMKPLYLNKTVTKDEYESVVFELAEAEAAVSGAQAALTSAKAAVEIADLNLGYTRITSRISGTIGRRLIDEGNLVKGDETILATVVTLNPIYAYFDLDERTVLRLRRMIQEGIIKSPQDVELPAQVAVADDPNYSTTGTINFIDNQLDGSTGTLRGRATVRNEDGLLSPGLFVRLRVPIGAPHKAVLIKEEALGSDQGQRFLYVVEKTKKKVKDKVTGAETEVEEDTVAYRRVQIGMLVGGKRVIESGLALGERVIVTGLQRVRPGVAVSAKLVDQDGKAVAQVDAGKEK